MSADLFERLRWWADDKLDRSQIESKIYILRKNTDCVVRRITNEKINDTSTLGITALTVMAFSRSIKIGHST